MDSILEMTQPVLKNRVQFKKKSSANPNRI